jgi:hypothetical protein
MNTKRREHKIFGISLAAICLLLFSASGLWAQEVFPYDSDGPYGIPAVKRALEDQFPPPSAWYGVTEKHLNRLGDRSSIALIKLLDDEDLRNPKKVIRALQIIRHSFLYPKMITLEEDRKSKFTLIFLEHLETVLRDPSLKREVSEVRKFVRDQTAKPTKMNDK